MDARRLQDLIDRGTGRAARHIGYPTDAYRPKGRHNPIAPANRFLRLAAAFGPAEGGFSAASRYGNPLFRGYFDAAYTQTGDYLVRGNSIWFIADQQPLLPVLCVMANRIVSLTRPASVQTVGSSGYSGIDPSSTVSLLSEWPASIIGTSTRGNPRADLPADSPIAISTALLPPIGNIVLSASDILTDDLGRTAIVASAELTSLGWRLSLKQAST